MIDDAAVTNNGDAEKVIATLAAIIIDFTDVFEEAVIRATGGNTARKRRYQIAIARHLDEIEEMFNVYAFINGQWETFRRNRNYEDFIMTRKENVILEEPKEPYMATASSNNDKKNEGRDFIKFPLSSLDTADLSKDPFIIRKREAALKALKDHPFPKELLRR